MKYSNRLILNQHPNVTHRGGMTLVEVVAALALAATALVGVLIAYGQAIRQQQVARQRVEAVRIADALLAEWFAQDGTLPIPASSREPTTGQIEGDSKWIWSVSEVEGARRVRPTAKRPFVVSTYRLDILAKASGQVPQRTLVSVDFTGSIEPVASAAAGSVP